MLRDRRTSAFARRETRGHNSLGALLARKTIDVYWVTFGSPAPRDSTRSTSAPSLVRISAVTSMLRALDEPICDRPRLGPALLLKSPLHSLRYTSFRSSSGKTTSARAESVSVSTGPNYHGEGTYRNLVDQFEQCRREVVTGPARADRPHPVPRKDRRQLSTGSSASPATYVEDADSDGDVICTRTLLELLDTTADDVLV